LQGIILIGPSFFLETLEIYQNKNMYKCEPSLSPTFIGYTSSTFMKLWDENGQKM
jgi:hypothetical protein